LEAALNSAEDSEITNELAAAKKALSARGDEITAI
jgi:hypothetical protein